MKKALRYVIVAVLAVALILGYYYYLSHRNDDRTEEDTTELTEVETIISRDFSANYPSSPRAVVKWYNRIITAYYGEDYTEEQLEQLADQARALMDEELLSYNSREDYLTNLKADIENYKANEKEIITSSVSNSNDITYAKVNGDDVAYVVAYYFSKEGSNYTRTYQEYVLRKDEEGRWKILTFYTVDGEDYED